MIVLLLAFALGLLAGWRLGSWHTALALHPRGRMSLVAFRAQNHPQQPTRDDVDDRAVRRDFFGPLHAEHRFSIDVAASAANAPLPRFWTRDDDALGQSWGAERVWCNPPYSDLEPWVEKAWWEMVDGTCELVVMLLPANRCEQGWWQRHVEPYRDGEPFHGVCLSTRFLPNRMRFDFPPGRIRPVKGDRPPFGNVLVTWIRPLDALALRVREGETT